MCIDKIGDRGGSQGRTSALESAWGVKRKILAEVISMQGKNLKESCLGVEEWASFPLYRVTSEGR